MTENNQYQELYNQIKRRWDKIAKPIDGLGVLEELICRIGAVTQTTDVRIERRCVVVMCADNGIVEEGVSQSGQEVTWSVASWMGKGFSTVCRLAGTAGAKVIPVDIGINANVVPEGVMDCKVAQGTENFLKQPAMTKEQCRQAIETGIAIAKKCKEDGFRIIASGEMGIGNTTTSAALLALLLKDQKNLYAGRGAGLDDAGLEKKKEVIRKAIQLYDGLDPFETLCAVGGLDIAGLAGLFIGGKRYHLPVVIDGAISAAAALCAELIEPGTKEAMLPSHIGKEPATQAALAFLGLDRLAVLHAELALGEGTGAVMLFPLLDMALSLYHKGIRFDESDVGQYERFTK